MSKKSSTELTGKTSPFNGFAMTRPDGSPIHVGYSRLSSYSQCPKQFKYSYVDKIRGKVGAPLLRGQAYHGSLEAMLQFKIDNNMELYPRERVDKLAIRMAKKEGLTEAEIYRVIDAVRYYYATLYPEKRPILVEADFKVVRGGITITGRLDEADEDGWIVDHKFSYDIWAEPRAKYGYQPIIYQWAGIDQIERARPGWVFRGFEYNIIRLFPHPMIQRIRIPRMNQEKSDWWENELFEMAKCMRRDYYPANPSEKACAFCFHKELCKPAIYKVEISKLGDQDDPNDAEDL